MPVIKQEYNAFSIQLRKLYIDSYTGQINDILYSYFTDINKKEA